MKKAIMFDLDDTLLWDEKSVKTAFRKTCNAAREKYDINPAELEERVREQARSLYAAYDTFPFTKMIGINPFEGLWADFSDEGKEFQKLKALAPAYRRQSWTRGLSELGIADPEFGAELAETFPVMRKNSAFVYDDTFSVLDQMGKKYKLLLLTNGSPSLQQTKLDLTPELKQYFNHIVISGSFGKGKPDTSIFEYAVGRLGLESNEVLMVGDNLRTDILGAVRSGIDSVWINRREMKADDVKPAYEIERLEELLPLLESLGET
ncbi:HAD family hydrolase [Virgibacillus siamensis]|uniref:HAD family hydrolase n=1 Tax=Virgibacillus siamensis TaxID=480071 RepID=UPI0009864A51|nr:HAD family hydrolase [Virgibacillus siamensis]